jgi:hypothetical protein
VNKFLSYGLILTKLAVSCLVVCAYGHAQLRGRGQLLYQPMEVEVPDLPALTAPSPHSADVMLTSLDTVFHDHEICCGKDSALEDQAAAADPKSLKDMASRLQGRRLLSDGRPIMVTATYVTPDAVNSGSLITWFQHQHAALMLWNGHVYVVHGIVYIWTASGTPESTQTSTVILKFLLWDTRYSDSRREVVFNRDTDDLNKVEGFLFVDAKPQ